MHVIGRTYTHALFVSVSFFPFPYATMSLELPLPTATYTVLGVFSVHHIALVIDVTTITTLTTEIILKWIDDFKGFWKNGWNILDLAMVIVVRKSACIYK